MRSVLYGFGQDCFEAMLLMFSVFKRDMEDWVVRRSSEYLEAWQRVAEANVMA